MIGIFFGFIFLFLLMASAFLLVGWKGKLKKNGWLPLALTSLLVVFSLVGYWTLGRVEHVIYYREDIALRQISMMLESTMPLPKEVHDEIKKELESQQNRLGAQPSVAILTAELAMNHQHYEDAKKAYEQAYQHAPEDFDIAVSYAQTWYLADKQQVSPELQALLNTLQEQDPDQTGLLNLLAVIAYNHSDYAQAISYWQQLLPRYSDNSVEAHTLQSAIANAQEKIKGK